MTYTRETAETLALKVLEWLAGQDDMMAIFLGSTGASKTDLQERAEDPEFLASVLDFLTMDDAWVVSFCDRENLPYDDPMKARMALPGGAQVNWT